MKIIANENVFEPIIEYLRKDGHQLISVREQLSGSSDDKIYQKAVKEKLVIVTMDKDFSRTLRFPPENCQGIIVIKIYRLPVDKTTELFIGYFKELDEEKITNNLVIIEPDGVRIRTSK